MSEDMLNLPLEDYILTFDDGLYSQYKFWPELRALNTVKIFFISTNIVCTGTQSDEYISCRDAHSKAFAGNTENYMTLEQIREMSQDANVIIGGHSHTHTRISEYRLLQKLQHIKDDTEQMLTWFDQNLGQRPTSFCFPYNDNYGGLYNAILKQYGFQNFYSGERLSIERLLTTTAAMSA